MRRPGWYWWAAMLASALGSGTAAVVISLHAQAESERKLCGIVIAQDDAYTDTPPTTPTGKRVAEAMDKLRRDLGCP
jgi:hypothetical protein